MTKKLNMTKSLKNFVKRLPSSVSYSKKKEATINNEPIMGLTGHKRSKRNDKESVSKKIKIDHEPTITHSSSALMFLIKAAQEAQAEIVPQLVSESSLQTFGESNEQWSVLKSVGEEYEEVVNSGIVIDFNQQSTAQTKQSDNLLNEDEAKKLSLEVIPALEKNEKLSLSGKVKFSTQPEINSINDLNSTNENRSPNLTRSSVAKVSFFATKEVLPLYSINKTTVNQSCSTSKAFLSFTVDGRLNCRPNSTFKVIN